MDKFELPWEEEPKEKTEEEPREIPEEEPREVPEEEPGVEITEKTEETKEETGEEEVQAHTEISDRSSEDEESSFPAAWPWLLGGAIALLAVIAAGVALWRKKRRKKAAAKEAALPLNTVQPVQTTQEPSRGGTLVGKLHHIGDRESQQDCFAVSPTEMMSKQGILAVVADGMGGLKDGDKVSQLVVSTMLNGFMSAGGHPQGILLTLVGQANQQVNRMLGAGVGHSGSTVVAGLARDGYFYYVSIGDSRICLFRNGQLIQLNREHIHRNDLAVHAMNGNGSLQAAFSNPKGGGLTSYIGMGQLKYVDIPAQPVRIQENDKFILMSDGVYNALTESEMVGALGAAPEQAAEQLSHMIAAKAFRNQDNYTAVILGF